MMPRWLLTCIGLGVGMLAQAQTVEILAADQILRNPDITEAQRLIGHVKLGHQDAVLTCDSAWRFDDGSVEVFSHVAMHQPPATTMTAEYLRIEPDQEWVLANGGVELQHETARLSAPSLMYLLNRRTARYTEGANIVDEGWTVNSRHGQYRTATATLELGGQVLAVNDRDTLRSDSLHWMRAQSRYRFLGATEWMGTDVHFSCLSGDIVMNEEPLGWLAGQVKVDDGEGKVHSFPTRRSSDLDRKSVV